MNEIFLRFKIQIFICKCIHIHSPVCPDQTRCLLVQKGQRRRGSSYWISRSQLVAPEVEYLAIAPQPRSPVRTIRGYSQFPSSCCCRVLQPVKQMTTNSIRLQLVVNCRFWKCQDGPLQQPTRHTAKEEAHADFVQTNSNLQRFPVSQIRSCSVSKFTRSEMRQKLVSKMPCQGK